MKTRWLRVFAFLMSLTFLTLLLLVGSTPATAQGSATTERVSVATNGTQANNLSETPSTSADGRYVAFLSHASNLVSGDTNGTSDIFVRDRQTGQTNRVSVATNGTQANDSVDRPSISADGRYVVFESRANNLVSGDTNGVLDDIFVHERETGWTSRVSVATNGTQANDTSDSPSISANGRYVVFESYASNLVSGDTNGTSDIFFHDRQTGQTSRVSVATNGTQGNGGSFWTSISADGRYVAFASGASNLVSSDTNGLDDIFVRDLQTGQTSRVSVATNGTQANDYSFRTSISADGRYVAFASYASNLVSSDTNGYLDVFVRDRDTDGDGIFDEIGQVGTSRVSVATNGTQGNNSSDRPSISANGRYVVFESLTSNLVSGDTNGVSDNFFHDRQTGQTSRVSVTTNGTQGNDFSRWSTISADGRYVAFYSRANNLVSGDTNGTIDIFVRDQRVGTAPPRPVVLVHGWNDTSTSWETYLGFLLSIGLVGYAVDTLDTGYGDGIPASIDENAQKLQRYIQRVKNITGAQQVDIVAHSMGGLITRRYIARYMNGGAPDVHQLIMLGTPNLGSVTARANELGRLSGKVKTPSSVELLPWFVLWFNIQNSERRNVPFYAIAGNYQCDSGDPKSNPIEPNPDDVVVSRDSVFAIPLNRGWLFPGPVANCKGDHRRMRSAGPDDGGLDIFNLYVKSLLQGSIPSVSGVQVSNVQETQTGDLQAAVEALDAVQFTDVQTGLLQPGGRLEFNRIPEPGSNISFIVVGRPDQMTVSLRNPNGQVITPGTSDPNVQYMQMDPNFMPLTSYTTNNPIAGTWTTIVQANTQTPAGGIDVATLGSLVSDLRLTIPVDGAVPLVNRPVAIKAQLRASSNPTLGASVSALLIHPNNTKTTLTLFDDGQHGDGAGGDGIYGNQFTPTTPGVYSAVISAAGTSGGRSFTRSAVWAVEVEKGSQLFLPIILKNSAGSSPSPTHTPIPTNTPTSTPTPTNTPNPGTTERISVASNGTQGNGVSYSPSISADGRYVVFHSVASNLVSGDTNGASDVFVHDRQTGQTSRVSIASNGTQGNSVSDNPSISADGRYVVFASIASNLVSGDTNNIGDIFVHDRQTGQTTRVSVASNGTQGNAGSLGPRPSISADGRYVVFHSAASNLVSGDTNGWIDVFIHDRQTGQTSRVSVASDGTQANGFSYTRSPSSISADGRYVVFHSDATNLVSGDINGFSWDVFVRDRLTGQTSRVSIASNGTQGNGESIRPTISADGRYVAFYSAANNLVNDDTNNAYDIFVHERQTGQTNRISIASNGMQGNNSSYDLSISADGRYITFWSFASNLVSGDTNGTEDVLIHDRQMGQTTRISIASTGTQANGSSQAPSISADGRYVTFQSDASNLVSGDTNGFYDVFIRDRGSGGAATYMEFAEEWSQVYLPIILK